MLVTIPDRRNNSYSRVVVEIADTCPVCGGPRGPLSAGQCREGDIVSVWHNECGHKDLYDDVIREAEGRASAYGYAALVDAAVARGADLTLSASGKIFCHDEEGTHQMSAAWLLGWLRWGDAIADAYDALTDDERAQLEHAERLAEDLDVTVVPAVGVDGVVRWHSDYFSSTGSGYSIVELETEMLSAICELQQVA